MSTSKTDIQKIRRLTIQGLICQFLPILAISWIEPLVEQIPGSEAIMALTLIFAIIAFCFGYALCGEAANLYAKYKGYKNIFFIYSVLNIYGLAVLFLLKNKNRVENFESDNNPLLSFSIISIVISWFAISIVLTPLIYSIALYFNGTEGIQDYVLNNKNLSSITNIFTEFLVVLYFIKELQQANINYKHILGSLNNIDFKLPVILTITKYFLNRGINSYTLYCLSFIFPKYVEAHINYKYATTLVSWIGFAIGAVIFAPITEEFFFRGIIFQKLALTKGVVKALVISAFLFAIIHFRYDIIPLFIAGLLYVILYLKTKQLAIPILCHFFYNSIVVITRLYYQIFPSTEITKPISIVEYQRYFIDHWQLNLLFIALSAPYLIYFIYKNFPRNYDIKKLPYYVNQSS